MVPVLTLALGLFVRSYVRTRDAVSRAQMRWLTMGVVASAGIGLVAFWIPELVARPSPVAGLLDRVGGAAAAARRWRPGSCATACSSIDVVVNRTLVYGGLTLGVVATYVGITSAIGLVVGSEHGFGISLLATGARGAGRPAAPRPAPAFGEPA